MYWSDEGFLLSRYNFAENSIIVETFTLDHGKYSGIVYGGSSRKQKKNFQIGNKILFNWKSRGENKSGYFNVELIQPIAPFFFDNKKKTACILAASGILKILLPENQVNKIIYKSFEKMLNDLKLDNWIYLYVYWELSLIKELGYEVSFLQDPKYLNKSIQINNKYFKIPKLLLKDHKQRSSITDIREALVFNKNLLIENFINPNRLKFPLFRDLLEKYYI